jgi:hypothetical protein
MNEVAGYLMGNAALVHSCSQRDMSTARNIVTWINELTSGVLCVN